MPKKAHYSDNNELLRKYHEAIAARNEVEEDKILADIIKANMGLITKRINKKLLDRATTLKREDFITEGIIGVITAARKFDPEKKVQFGTYADFWIRQKIQRALYRDQGIRIPHNLHPTLGRIWEAQRELTHVLCRKPTNKEVADKLDLKEEQVELLSRSSLPVFNFGQLVPADDEDLDFEDLLVDLDVEDQYDRAIFETDLEGALKGLTEFELEVLELYLQEMTQKKIGQVLGTNQMAISRTLAQIRHKLQEHYKPKAAS